MPQPQNVNILFTSSNMGFQKPFTQSPTLCLQIITQKTPFLVILSVLHHEGCVLGP